MECLSCAYFSSIDPPFKWNSLTWWTLYCRTLRVLNTSSVYSKVCKHLFPGLACFIISMMMNSTIATFTLSYRRKWMSPDSSATLTSMLWWIFSSKHLAITKHGVTSFKQVKYPRTFGFGTLKEESYLFSTATLRCCRVLCTLQWIPKKLKTWICNFYCFNLKLCSWHLFNCGSYITRQNLSNFSLLTIKIPFKILKIKASM